MNKVFNSICILALLSFFMAVPARTNAVTKSNHPHAAAVISAGNGIYNIYVEDSTPDFGTYTVATGANHPATIAMGTPQDVLFAGAAGNPWSTYLTVRSYTSLTEYTSSASPSASPGYSQVDLDTYAGPVTSGPNWVANNWLVNNVADVFSISQLIVVEGTTINDSRIRVSTSVSNGGAPIDIGIRYEWDIMIDGEDGSYVKTVDPYSGWYSTEQEISSPVINQFQAVNDPSSPIFYINGSVNGPAFSPLPTPPSLMQFADWGLVDGEAFDYTPTGQTIAGPSNDSAVTYYWGDNVDNAITLGVTESTDVTQYLFAPMTESLPSVLPQTGSE